jgi:DNA-binding response OmpR family regulator
VLLVDREGLYRWFVAESLRECNVEVVACGSMEGAAIALRGPLVPDLVIVDSGMLEGRGADTLSAMRADEDVPPCVVLDSHGEMSRSLLGLVTVATKPVDAAAVVTLVTSHLRRNAPFA